MSEEKQSITHLSQKEAAAVLLARALLRQIEAESPQCAFWVISVLAKMKSEKLSLPCVFNIACQEMPKAAADYVEYTRTRGERIDPIKIFVSECCELNADAKEMPAWLWSAYIAWCAANHSTLLPCNIFLSRLGTAYPQLFWEPVPRARRHVIGITLNDAGCDLAEVIQLTC